VFHGMYNLSLSSKCTGEMEILVQVMRVMESSKADYYLVASEHLDLEGGPKSFFLFLSLSLSLFLHAVIQMSYKNSLFMAS